MGFQNSEEIEKQKREIISYIKNLIVEQDLKEHDHLPSENQLFTPIEAIPCIYG